MISSIQKQNAEWHDRHSVSPLIHGMRSPLSLYYLFYREGTDHGRSFFRHRDLSPAGRSVRARISVFDFVDVLDLDFLLRHCYTSIQLYPAQNKEAKRTMLRGFCAAADIPYEEDDNSFAIHPIDADALIEQYYKPPRRMSLFD